MKRTILAAVALLASACVDNRSSILIGGRAAPSDITTCQYAAGGLNQLGTGLLDVGGTAMPNYQMVVYVTNNLADPTTVAATGFKGAKAWSADSAKVRLNPPDYVNQYGPNPALLATQSENVLPLDGLTTVEAGGQGTQYLEALSGALGAQLATQVAPGQTREVVLGITLQGHTADGAHLDTGEWYFGLKLCNGCLAPPTCPTGSTLTRTNCFSIWQDSVAECKTTQ